MQGTKQEFKGKNWPFLKQNLAQWANFAILGELNKPFRIKESGSGAVW